LSDHFYLTVCAQNCIQNICRRIPVLLYSYELIFFRHLYLQCCDTITGRLTNKQYRSNIVNNQQTVCKLYTWKPTERTKIEKSIHRTK